MRILRGWYGEVGFPGEMAGVGESVAALVAELVGEPEGIGEAEDVGVAVGVGVAAGVGEVEVIGVTSARDVATPTLRMSEEIAMSAVAPDLTLSSIHQRFLYMLDK